MLVVTAAASLPPEDAQQGLPHHLTGLSGQKESRIPLLTLCQPSGEAFLCPFSCANLERHSPGFGENPPRGPVHPAPRHRAPPPSDALLSALAPARKSTPSLSQSRHQLPRFPLPASPGMADGTGDRLSDAHPLRVKCVYAVVCTSVFPSLSPTFLFCFVFL